MDVKPYESVHLYSVPESVHLYPVPESVHKYSVPETVHLYSVPESVHLYSLPESVHLYSVPESVHLYSVPETSAHSLMPLKCQNTCCMRSFKKTFWKRDLVIFPPTRANLFPLVMQMSRHWFSLTREGAGSSTRLRLPAFLSARANSE